MENLLTITAEADPEDINELVKEAYDQWWESTDRNPQERLFNSIFSMYYEYGHGDITRYSFKDTVEVLGLLSNEELATKRRLWEEKLPENVSFKLGMPDEAWGLGVEFISRVSKEVRNSICGNNIKTGYTGQKQITKDLLASSIASSLASCAGN